MIFEGIDNQTVEVRVTNYQYPDLIDGSWDSNWLNIYLNVKSNIGHWQTIDPALTTWDIQRMIKWFESLSCNKLPDSSAISFTEPNLSFELLSQHDIEKKTFRINFDLDFRPQSATSDLEYFVDVIADNNNLKRIVEEFKIELKKYPERKPEHNSSLQKSFKLWWQQLFGQNKQ